MSSSSNQPLWPFLCPKCSALVGHTDGEKFLPLTLPAEPADPVDDYLITPVVTIRCDCGHEWEWRPRP